MLIFPYCWQDLDAYQDEDDDYDNGGLNSRMHYVSGAPSGWDDPGNNEVLPPYLHVDVDRQDYHPVPNISRGESFVSSGMFVWGLSKATESC